MPADRRAALYEALGAAGTAARDGPDHDGGRPGPRPPRAAAVAAGIDAGLALWRTANEAAAEAERARSIDQNTYASLLRMEQRVRLTATQAKIVLAEMLESGATR